MTHTRIVEWTDQPMSDIAELSGLEVMAGIRDGRIARPPMAAVVNLDIVAVAEGRIEFRCTPGPEHYNNLGIVHGGLLCTVLDTAAGCALQSALPPGVGYTSIEIKVSYLRRVTLHDGPVRAVGTLVKRGRRVCFADAVVLDADGRTLAAATSSFLLG